MSGLPQSRVAISARLLPAIEVGGAWLSIEPTSDVDRYGKPRWNWYVDLPDGVEVEGSDFFGWDDAQGMLGTFCAFLCAFAEAQRYEGSENRDLFPSELAEWAVENDDELSLAVLELEGEETDEN